MNAKRRIKFILNFIIKDLKNAKWAILMVIAYFLFLHFAFGSLCPFTVITGFPCPGCGLTRAGILLLHFHFQEAFQMHPLIYFLLIYVILFFLERYCFPKNNYKYSKGFGILLIIAAIVIYLLRMYLYFPNTEPMTIYAHSLLHLFSQ